MGNKSLHLFRSVVRNPKRPDLASIHEPVERGSQVSRVRVHVRPVDLIEVDDVGSKPSQRVIESLSQIRRRGVVGDGGSDAALRGENHLISQPGSARNDSAEQLLGLAEGSAAPVESVHVCSVDEIHPALQGDFDDTGGHRNLMADETPLPKAQRTHVSERSQSSPRTDIDGHVCSIWAIFETLVLGAIGGFKIIAAPPDLFRYGVIGTGMMGIEHIENINHIPGAAVTAYADPHADSRAAADILTEGASGFEDYRDLLGSDLVDAVVIATPNFTHVDILEAALGTDLHILIEKPLCTTIADCERVIEWSRHRQAVTWVGMEYRYMPPVTRLIQEVEAGTVGDLRMVAVREHRFPFLRKVGDWNRFNRHSGGTMVEKCCHFFDLMNEIIGASPTRLVASGGQDVNHLDEVYDGETPDILDNAYVIVEYDSGVRAMLDLCMFAEATKNQEEVVAVGTRGKVEALLPDKIVRIGRRGTHFVGDVEEHHVDDERITYHGHHQGSSQLEHLDFIATCRAGGQPGVSLEDGLLAVAMGLAAQVSIERGTWVDVSEVLQR